MKKKITELIRERRVYFDGGTGSMIQSMGLEPGEEPALWNRTHPDRIASIYRQYYEAGCDVVSTNTFGINRTKFEDYDELIQAAVRICREEADKFEEDKYVALDIGPLGQLLEPLGKLPFEEAVSIYADTIRAAEGAGADVIIIETMNDAHETKAAVLAAKENSDLPIIVSNVFDSTGRMMTGGTPGAMAALLEGLRVDAVGMNCSLGPDHMVKMVEEYVNYTSLPLIVMPNAGLPKVVDGETVYSFGPEIFSDYMVEIARKGGCILGGCCGTTPEHIRQTIEKTKDLPYRLPEKKDLTVVSSYTHHLEIGEDPVLIGERINPTGKKKLKEALRSGDMDYILNEGLKQEEAGAQALDVNVGLPEIDEPAMIYEAVKALQAVTDLPLQIDTSDPVALEKAMRIYNGKPMVNSVNGKQAVMDQVFPLVKKYGGAVVALTIGEEGIPEDAAGRLQIALHIIEEAKKYGIDQKDIIVDPLAMAISSAQDSARVALEVIRELKKRGIRTIMGVSNISFGLPKRDLINSAFFVGAMSAGLSCAIMNPFSVPMMDAWHAFRALNCNDANCLDYIKYTEERVETAASASLSVSSSGTATSPRGGGKDVFPTGETSALKQAIVSGMTDRAARLTKELLQTEEPLNIINGHIVPALDEIGKAFESGKVYLPQLLMSADAASGAFEKVKEKLPASDSDRGRMVILATVQGDVHDIGKNIVKVLLQSYGFYVLDLGKDVAPEVIRDTALETGCKLVGLSALMTTTVPAMEETIRLIRETDPSIKVMVGGAVLTQEYADKIGADRYSPDAMDAVRYAEEFYKKLEAGS